MKNKKIIFLSLGLLLIVTTLVISIAAWLTDTDQAGNDTTFTVGKVEYKFTGAFNNDSNPIVPGAELVDTPFGLTNSSTVSSEIRVTIKVESKKYDEVEYKEENPVYIFPIANLDDLFAANWNYNYNDGYWYYEYGSPNPNSVLPPNTHPTTLLTSLKLDGSYIGNSYQNALIKITFTFQAKQADYVTWEDLGSVDFTLGI